MTVPPPTPPAPPSPPHDPDHEPPVWSAPSTPSAPQYSAPQYPTPQYSAPQYATAQYSTPPPTMPTATPPPTMPTATPTAMPPSMPPAQPPLAAPVPPSGGRNRIALIISIVAVLLLAGGGVAWFALSGKDSPQAKPKPSPSVPHRSPDNRAATLAKTQAAIARSATTFLNALGNDQPAKFCPLWDPANLQADLDAYNIPSCQRLTLSNEQTKQLYRTIAVSTPSAIKVTGDKAVIPMNAFSPAKSSDLAMQRGSDGTWRALFYNPANGPSTPSPQPSVPYTSSTGVAPPSGAESASALSARFLEARHMSCPSLDGFFADAKFCNNLRPVFVAATGTPKIAFYGTGGTMSFTTKSYGIVDLAITLDTDNKWIVQYIETDSTFYATESLPGPQWGTAMQAIVSAYRNNDCRAFAENYFYERTDHPSKDFCKTLAQSSSGAALRADPSLTPAFLGGNSSFAFFSLTWSDGSHHTMVFVQSNPSESQYQTHYVLLVIEPTP